MGCQMKTGLARTESESETDRATLDAAVRKSWNVLVTALVLS